MDVAVSRLQLPVVQKYKIYVCDTKLAELNDSVIHSHACAFSNYHCVLDHLTDAVKIACLILRYSEYCAY
jgi:hypothetical protein